MAIIQLDLQNFHDVINNSEIPVIVDFYADWCQPCKRIAPLLEEIATEQEGKAMVCKVNVDENQALAAEFSVMNIPYVMSFKGGVPYKNVIGAVAKSALQALLD